MTTTEQTTGISALPLNSMGFAPEKSIDQAAAAFITGVTSGWGSVALPQDFKLHDLEAYLPTRRRARGTMSTPYINDFVAYVLQHQDNGCSIFVDASSMSAVAVLDLGTPQEPGHCGHKAKLAPRRTAAYQALLDVCDGQKTQKELAEWLEDWSVILEASADGVPIDIRKAITAVRNITIEGMAKASHVEESLSASRSTFESVKASSDQGLPTHFTIACQPYADLPERDFALRMSVLTDASKPRMQLRIQRLEQHTEEMALELVHDIRTAVGDAVPVLIGTYEKAA